VLPYGGGIERRYDALQQIVANLGPLLGVALMLALGVFMVAGNLGRVPVGPAPPQPAVLSGARDGSGKLRPAGS
jgi:hypothetical protein